MGGEGGTLTRNIERWVCDGCHDSMETSLSNERYTDIMYHVARLLDSAGWCGEPDVMNDAHLDQRY